MLESFICGIRSVFCPPKTENPLKNQEVSLGQSLADRKLRSYRN